jgi:2-C-methyl-D-erythritol 4-phosphate cytidylyltransferase
MKVSAIIPAAGVGSRFSKNIKKQFFEINQKPIIYYTILSLIKAYDFEEIIIGCGKDDFNFVEEILKSLNINNFKIVNGGEQRSDTVYNCLLENQSDFVLIHDSVRPFVKKEIINTVIEDAFKIGASICALPVRDTVKQINQNIVKKTIDRDILILSHTPQVFNSNKLLSILKMIKNKSILITDEAMAFEIAGEKVSWVKSSPENIKITYTEDMEIINILSKKFGFI